MADDKKNPWWEATDGQEGGEPPPEQPDDSPDKEEAAREEEEDFVSQTPPTIKVGGGAAPNVPPGPGFPDTPPTIQLSGSPPPTGAQGYPPFPQPGTGFPGAFPGGFPQGLPVMPGTMPGAAPGMVPGTGIGPTGADAAQYQTLKLSDLGPGVPYATQGGNLGLLLDVSVPMTVVLGRSVMRIQEVLGLQPGSVVTLDSTDGEPVDLLIKDKLIAQGEVVVIEGNYGIKITKIVAPEQRVKDLG